MVGRALFQFNIDMTVYATKANGDFMKFTARDLLPSAFTPSHLLSKWGRVDILGFSPEICIIGHSDVGRCDMVCLLSTYFAPWEAGVYICTPFLGMFSPSLMKRISCADCLYTYYFLCLLNCYFIVIVEMVS